MSDRMHYVNHMRSLIEALQNCLSDVSNLLLAALDEINDLESSERNLDVSDSSVNLNNLIVVSESDDVISSPCYTTDYPTDYSHSNSVCLDDVNVSSSVSSSNVVPHQEYQDAPQSPDIDETLSCNDDDDVQEEVDYIVID